MAKAVPRGGVNQMRTLKYTHNAAVTDGDVIVVNGQVLVSCGDYAAIEEGIYIFRGPVEFPKEAALAIAAGEVCYWDSAVGEADKTGTNTKAGICTEGAAAADTVVLIELGENK